MDLSIFTWGLAIVVGVPALLLILGFGTEQLERRHNPLAKVLRRVYLYVLPALAVLLVMRQLFRVERGQVSARAIETCLWLAVLMAVLALLNAVLTTTKRETLWQIRVPNLLFQVARVLVVLAVAFYLLSGVWKFNLTNLVTALGVGSLAVALALQDTLSNLVSGFLLLLEGPVRVGDWVTIGELRGEVIDLNWRSVRLRDAKRNIIIIPNGVVAQETIDNNTLHEADTKRHVCLNIAYENPPNRVKAVLKEAAESVEGVKRARPLISEFESYSIQYTVEYYIDSAISENRSQDAILTCLYYAAKRHQLTIRYPISIEYGIKEDPNPQLDRQLEVREFLRSLPYFGVLEPDTLDHLVANSRLDYYGVGDRVLQIGEFDEGMYVILEGRVRVAAMDVRHSLQEVSQLSRGDFFGELTLLVEEPSPVSVTAIEDLVAIVITDKLISQLLQRSPKLGVEIGQIIDESHKVLRVIQGRAEIPNGVAG